MIIFLLNAGSSSLKFQLIDMKTEKALIKGACEKIQSDKSFIKSQTHDGRKIQIACAMNNHKDAFNQIKKMILDKDYGVIADFSEIFAIGHRIVHGGKYFEKAALIDETVIEKIQSLIELAPLHNQSSLNVILTCKELFGSSIPQVAVFDTSFYFDLPPKAYMFGIPYEYYEKYNIRKYGFHGISHKFVSQKCAEMLGKSIKDLKIITCHLGNGSSITAIDRGNVVDTSMGLTPLGGIMMGTRSGSLDPSVVTFITEKENLSSFELNIILNKKSGLLGVSGVSNDEREISEAIKNGNKRAILAREMFNYQIIKYIGAYTAAMNGCDAIIFTAGIGENQWIHREVICENLAFMGVELDKALNKQMIFGKQGKISSKESKVEVFVIATNEELVIAKETLECINTEKQ